MIEIILASTAIVPIIAVEGENLRAKRDFAREMANSPFSTIEERAAASRRAERLSHHPLVRLTEFFAGSTRRNTQ